MAVGYFWSFPRCLRSCAKLECSPHRSATAVYAVMSYFLGTGKRISSCSLVHLNLRVLIINKKCLHYGKKYSKRKALAIFFGMIILFSGFEAGMIYAVRVSVQLRRIPVKLTAFLSLNQPSYNAGNTAPVKFFGIVSPVIISLALL